MIVPRAGAASGIRRGVGTPAIWLSIQRRSRQPARTGRGGADHLRRRNASRFKAKALIHKI
jgi:hypothetical protein